jgi:hypothetical protein
MTHKILKTVFVVVFGVVFGFATVTGAAKAFDVWASDDDNFILCFTGSDWTTAEKDRVDDGRNVWDTQIYAMTLALDWSNCPSSYVELDWVSDLGGSLGVADYTPYIGPNYIRFARNWASGNPISWYTGSSSNVPSGQYDLWSTAQHEIGHAFGLKHPEHNDQYEWKSFDNGTPIMKANAAVSGSSIRRTLTQDDRAGGEFNATSNQNIIGQPTASVIGDWGKANGSLTDCGSYLCLSKNVNTTYSYMYKTQRVTVNSDASRDHAVMKFDFKGSTYSTGMQVRPVVRSIKVLTSGANSGSWLYSYGAYCTDTTGSSWQTCTSSPLSLRSEEVDDIRLYIRNYSKGLIYGGTVLIDNTWGYLG